MKKNFEKYKNKIFKFFKNNIVNSINCWTRNWSVCRMLKIHRRCVYKYFKSDSLVMRKNSENEIDEILKNNFTNNKTLWKNTVHAHFFNNWLNFLSIFDKWLNKTVNIEKNRIKKWSHILFFNKNEIAYVLWTFPFMKTAKIFWQN